MTERDVSLDCERGRHMTCGRCGCTCHPPHDASRRSLLKDFNVTTRGTS